MKVDIIIFFRRLFCKHNYEKIAWREEEDKLRNEMYAERLYKCNKCGKEKWVDGRFDPYW